MKDEKFLRPRPPVIPKPPKPRPGVPSSEKPTKPRPGFPGGRGAATPGGYLNTPLNKDQARGSAIMRRLGK